MNPSRLLADLLLSEPDPVALRARWLEAMTAALDGQAALAHGVRWDPTDEVLRICHLQTHGSATLAEIGATIGGLALADPGAAAENAAPMNAAACCTIEELPVELADALWRPTAIHSALVINSVVDGRFVGNLNVYRTHHHPRFEPADAQRPDWVAETVRMLSATDSLLGTDASDERLVLLYDTDGTLRLRGDRTNPKVPEHLDIAGHVRALMATSERTAEHYPDVLHLELTKLQGHHDAGVLVVVEPMLDWQVHDLLMLTRTQRRIAAYAAHGATAPEIAKTMRRSPTTVRTHLKNIYTALGISTRAELAEAYTQSTRQAPKAPEAR